MGCNEGSATISFPENLITEEIREYLQNDYGVIFPVSQTENVRLMDVEYWLNEGIFSLHDSQACDGVFEELEKMLVERGIPFDRETNMDWNIPPEIRIFRPEPDGMDFTYPMDYDGNVVVSVKEIRKFLDLDDAGEEAASSIRAYLDEHFPAYPPLEAVCCFSQV